MKICSACGREYPDDIRFCQDDGTTLRSAGSKDLIGSVIADRYHITQKLGEGGMGAVYLGEHVKMGRKSAIKVIAQAMSNDVDAIARFNREAANAAQINHPNVCGIYDFGETPDGLIYLAMEFIEGEALTAILAREGAFSPGRAAHILHQTASALQAAHDLGIVHRDLKPDNIMIARDRDGSDIVKVVDFGIAKAIGGDSGQQVTKTGLVVGTPEYMSPEQLSGDQLDGRSDIYSLGLVFFRMVTGVLPFQAESSQEVMIKRLTDEPMRLNDALPGAGFPAAVQQAVDKALQRMPGDRYSSPAEFGRDVQTAVQGVPDVAPKIDVAASTQVFPPGSQGPTAQLPKTHVQGREAPPPATRKQRPTTQPTPMPLQSPVKKKPSGAIAAVVVILLVGGVGSAVFLSTRSSNEAVTPNEGAETIAQTQPNDGGAAPIDSQSLNGGNNRTQPVEPVDSGSQPTPPIDNTDPQPDNNPPVGIVVNPANAGDHLIDLLFLMEGDNTPASLAAAVRDTALAYYELAGVARAARADAAYVLANAYARLNERTQALEWARRAVNMDPSQTSYQQLLSALQRNQ